MNREETEVLREDTRENLREDVRANPADLLAKLRAESLHNMNDAHQDETDPFFVPPELKPAGWIVEWKVTHIMGQPDKISNQVRLADGGWIPAPIELFRKMRPAGFTGTTIEQDGQILMMRPVETNDEARKREGFKAKKQLNDKLSSLGMGKTEGQMDSKRVVNQVNRTYEKMTIPE